LALLPYAMAGISVLLSGTTSSWASPRTPKTACWDGQGRLTRTLHGTHIEIKPDVDHEAKDEPFCGLLIEDSARRKLVSEIDYSFSILETNLDVNGDGIPDLIVEAYSGGAHCCWTYYIVQLGPNPRLLHKIENDRAISFYPDKSTNAVYLTAEDGVFDYFDGFCHACTVFPEITLRFEGGKIFDASPQQTAWYDKRIVENQKALSTKDREILRSVTGEPRKDDAEGGPGAITRREPDRAARALAIVLAYLYSGREKQARQALKELWPPFDQERMWSSILDTREKGLLCYTRGDSTCSDDPAGENRKKVFQRSYRAAPDN
jgi:hypothetical protein